MGYALVPTYGTFDNLNTLKPLFNIGTSNHEMLFVERLDIRKQQSSRCKIDHLGNALASL